LANKLFQLQAFISYWLDAVDEHSLHSPFFYDFYTQVIKADSPYFGLAENLRRSLLNDKRSVHIEDLGVQSKRSGNRCIGQIAKASLTPPKLSSLYQRIIQNYDHNILMELGSSLGINTLYLASKKGSHVTTFEGSAELIKLAKLTFEFAHAANIIIVPGNIDTTLSTHLSSVRKIDFVLIDANHRYEPTLKYFNQIITKVYERSVVVIDDIHYSEEMKNAWNTIKNHKLVYASADLYRCGILFFDPSLNKQHVILQF
jgi:predicted O-methyltransferase YrrM